MEVTIAAVICIVSGLICYPLARNRNRGPLFWAIMGIIFAGWAPLLLIMIGERYKNDKEEAEAIARRRMS